MRNSYIRLAIALGMVLTAAAPAQPQTSELTSWTVDVQRGHEASPNGYSGELYNRLQQKTASAELGIGNAFEFRQVPCGEYLLVVRDAHGEAVHQEFVSASPSGQPVTIRLPNQEQPRPTAGTVSVAELLHPPARKAIQAALRGVHFTDAGQYEKAAEQFRKAIDISPGYAAAYSGLAASNLRMHNYREAAEEASHAMEISRDDPADLCNLSLAQSQLKRIADATATARRWLAMEPENPKAHLVLGLLLTANRRTYGEAAQHLERAAKDLPEARERWAAVRDALAQSAAVAGPAGPQTPE